MIEMQSTGQAKTQKCSKEDRKVENSYSIKRILEHYRPCILSPRTSPGPLPMSGDLEDGSQEVWSCPVVRMMSCGLAARALGEIIGRLSGGLVCVQMYGQASMQDGKVQNIYVPGSLGQE